MTAVPIVRLPHGTDLDLPAYATEHAAGLDLMAAITEPMTIAVGKRAMVPTGIAIALPVGFEAQVRPRSGLAAKNGVTVLNSPGTIDADYRGEIKVILINLGEIDFLVEPKSRIAQLIVAPVVQIRWDEVDTLPQTARGEGGFGSTGLGKTGV
ncbi:MAG TPA: dUTP diphosphatase [Alphaproteobacteria bacterium]|jgi:dUTP pyrophosphatase|nr:dUTP diphosphatase [Alphaproteobacteria bacterium]